jgi:phospholipase/carboxylesterase
MASGSGRLFSRPGLPASEAGPGLHPLRLDRTRDALLYVPPALNPESPAPLVLWLHGANGDAQNGVDVLRRLSDRAGFLVLAPASRGYTWDFVLGGFGADVARIDEALARTFRCCRVDTGRVAICGFSDGASAALSLGIANGDLFTHIIAFSPGFLSPPERRGSPRVFLAHGTRDRVLPVEKSSRRIAPLLTSKGYDLTYEEFKGPHAMPEAILRAAIAWLMELHP